MYPEKEYRIDSEDGMWVLREGEWVIGGIGDYINWKTVAGPMSLEGITYIVRELKKKEK